ncbi:MAG: CDP-glycerol glycerophosphotransferase family protein [Opitutales bacterium]|nr:CDP-glycerol glycerophosphotransferase family protein [Opitutales bacterium]
MSRNNRETILELSVAQIATAVTWLLSKLIPTAPKLVLFGAMNGRWYGDNSRDLFEWILGNRPDLKPVWMTRNPSVHEALKREGKPVAKTRSIRGWWLQLRAPLAVFTNRLTDFSPHAAFVPTRMRLLALRHGRSVKRVRFARLEHALSPKEERERMRESRVIAKAISTSEFISDIQEECLKIGRDKHVVTGYPRNDCLLEPTASMRRDWSQFLGEQEVQKVILYGPSWRHGREPTRFFPFPDFEKEQIFSFLKDHCALLLLRPHANDLLKYPDQKEFLISLTEECPFVRLATHDDWPDVNSMLPFVDILISDYSALYHDFLLLDRPIILIPYDFDEFSYQNGFLYDYIALAPGPLVKTMDEFVSGLSEAIRDPQKSENQRRNLREMIHTYTNAGSCARVAEVVESLLPGNQKSDSTSHSTAS